jgi:hypothetical protein
MKCTLLSHHQNAGQNHNIRPGNIFFEYISQLKYLGMAISHQNLIQEKSRGECIMAMLATIQSRTFYLLVCCLKHKDWNIQTLTFVEVLHGCETWSLTLRVEHRITVSEMGKKKRKSNLPTGCGGPYICETSRLPHFLNNLLTDGNEIFSLMCWLPFIPRKISFLLQTESTLGL